jgi:type IV pilus assembly protein PilM
MSTSPSDKAIVIQDSRCGTCQTINSAGRRYCGGCGQRLWEPCNECRTPNATDLKYCGHCGTDLQQVHQRRVADLQNRLARFEALRQEAQFREARAALEAIEDPGDTRLQPLLAEVQAKLDALSDEQTARSAEAAQMLSQAERALNELDYFRALRILQQIPRGLRDQKTQQAWKIASSRVQEIQTLTERIKSARQTQSYDGVLQDVHRLLELQPGHPMLRKLATQLAQRQRYDAAQTIQQRMKVARQRLQEGRYGAAAASLEAIVEDQVTPAHRPLYDAVMELDAVVRCLKQEPYLHRELLGAARRWQQLRPDDSQAMRILQKVRKRLATPTQCAPFAPAWAKPPETCHLVGSLRWWRGVKRAKLAGEMTDYQSAPGRFLVAYGLALQGLGVARLQLNLLPRANPRSRAALFQRLSVLPKSLPGTVWGCDLGHSGLKALEMRRDKSTGALEITRAVIVPHSRPLSEAEDDPAVTASWRETMSTFAEQHAAEGTSIVLGFSGPRTLGRSFEMPKFNHKKAEEAIAYEARMQIPIPVDQISYDWFAWPSGVDDTSFQQVTLVAARRQHVQQVLDACADAPVKVLAVQSVCLALYNAAMAEFFAAEDRVNPDSPESVLAAAPPAKPLAVLDVGATSSTLVIAAPHLVRYRNLPLGTTRLDEAMMSRFHVTRPHAQQLRHQPSSAPWLYQVNQVINPVVDELASEVRRTLRAYEREGIECDRLLVTGGGSEQFGLLRRLVHGA